MKKIVTIYLRQGLSPRRTTPLTTEEVEQICTTGQIPLENGKTLILGATAMDNVILEVEEVPDEAPAPAENAAPAPAIEGGNSAAQGDQAL
jgi:hypothetical protein